MAKIGLCKALNTGKASGPPAFLSCANDGRVTFVAIGSGVGPWSATLVFAEYVNGQPVEMLTLTINEQQPINSMLVDTAGGVFGAYLSDNSSNLGRFEVSGFVDAGNGAGNISMSHLGLFATTADRDMAPGTYAESGGTCTVSGVQYAWQGAAVGWVDASSQRLLRMGVVGDSIDVFGGGIALALSCASAGKIRRIISIATQGDTSTDQLGKISALAGQRLDFVVVKLGTNDAYKSGTPNFVPVVTYTSNMIAIGRYIQSIGARPIFVSLPPRSDGGAQYMAEYSRELEKLCLANNWFLSRRWRQLNDGTGAFISGGSHDTLHPYTHWLISEGQGLLSDMNSAGLFPKPPQLRSETNSLDFGGKFTNTFFLTDTNADGLADGVSKLGSGTATLTSASIGKFQNLAVTASSGNNGLGISFSGLVIGRKYNVRGFITVAVSSGTMRLNSFNGVSGSNMFPVISANADMNIVNSDGTVTLSYDEEFTATSTSGTLNIYDPGNGATFTLSLSEWQCWDLTALGLA